MASTTITKVTSLGSQSDGPTVLHPTPATEALERDVVAALPPMDFAAVTKILDPIAESLNESAEEALYPSPPINTPIVASPTPSLSVRLPFRARGFSAIGDRLAKLKIEERKPLHRHHHHHHRGTDVASSSNRCIEPSVAEESEECDMASISEVMSEGCKDKDCPGHVSTSMSPPRPSPLGQGSVPIGLGSPTVNPRIEEYLSFTSKDLPTQAPPPTTGTTLAEHASSTSTTALDGDSLCSRVSFKSDGVTEKSNWAEELEDNLDRTCYRLEQLAHDEHTADPTRTVEEYYVARLRRLLGASTRQVPVKIAKMSKEVKGVKESKAEK
tara:strand:+ start:18438 stop:19418 length:981 start_codon:yes stop_codon:yes gene_type:complete